MGCGKSKHAVATATVPTAVSRKNTGSNKKSGGGDASVDKAAAPRHEDVTPPMPPPTGNDSVNQEPSGGGGGDDNEENAAVDAKREEQGELICRESPSRFFSSRKDEEFVVAGGGGDGKSECDDSDYASPRTESTGRDNSFNDGGEVVEAGKGGEEIVVEAGELAAAGVVVVESPAPEAEGIKQQIDDRKEEEKKLGNSSAENGITEKTT